MDTIEVKRRYLKEPTIEQILSFIDEVGTTYAHFEYYYGMTEGTIKNVKAGTKKLPVRYWPIFYDRIVPTYGIGEVPKKVPKQAVKTHAIRNETSKIDNHGRLSNLKTK